MINIFLIKASLRNTIRKRKHGSNSACYCFYLKTTLSSLTYSPSRRQAGAPEINIESELLTAPCLRSQCYLVVPVIHTQFLRSLVCVYAHARSSQYTDAGWAKELKKFVTAVNAACEGDLFAYHKVCQTWSR